MPYNVEVTGDRQERPQGAYVVGRPCRPPRYGAAPPGRPGRSARSRAAYSGTNPSALATALFDGLQIRPAWSTASNRQRSRRCTKLASLARGAACPSALAHPAACIQLLFSATHRGAVRTTQRTDVLARGAALEDARRHEEGRNDCRRYNVKVTGTLRQGAARCTISSGTVRPLAATCPSRPFC